MQTAQPRFPVAWTLALAIVYFAASELGLSMAQMHTSVSPVWPPTGIAIASLLLAGSRLWPGVFIGALAANLSTGVGPAAAAGIATGNTLEALVAVGLVRRFIGNGSPLDTPAGVLRFVAIAAVASIVSATVGTTSLLAAGEIASDRFGPLWATWWLGDTSGAIVVAPLILSFWAKRRADENPAGPSLVALGLLLAVQAVVGVVVFSGWTQLGRSHDPIQFLTLPVMLWSALRFGQRGVALAAGLLSSIAIAGTLNGHGPFAGESGNESLLVLQGFICTITVVFLVLAAAIAERARVEAENARLYEESRTANRLKDEFLAVVSHELRNPLHAIFGWLRILQEGSLSGEDAGRALATLERNVLAQARLVDDLLDVSRIVEGKLTLDLEQVYLSPLVETAVESASPAAAAKDVGLESDIRRDQDLVLGDPVRLQQVIGNVLSNAIKFTPPGGRVYVSLDAGDGHVRIRVCDTGQGIAPEFLPYVFERFRQADGSTRRGHGGLGLGLTIVRRLVELHGGRVEVESPGEGLGTTVTISIPRAAA
jgi:signal transduction histidine kinase